MAKEIERKFLPAKGSSVPLPEDSIFFKIKQGYILLEKGKQLRVRISKFPGSIYIAQLCLKFTGNQIRDEYEYNIPMKDGKEMYTKCTMTLEKNRTTFEMGNEVYDIDMYPNGLITVEIEFKSIKALKKWKKPSWLGEEISGVSKYSNIALAKKNLKF